MLVHGYQASASPERSMQVQWPHRSHCSSRVTTSFRSMMWGVLSAARLYTRHWLPVATTRCPCPAVQHEGADLEQEKASASRRKAASGWQAAWLQICVAGTSHAMRAHLCWCSLPERRMHACMHGQPPATRPAGPQMLTNAQLHHALPEVQIVYRSIQQALHLQLGGPHQHRPVALPLCSSSRSSWCCWPLVMAGCPAGSALAAAALQAPSVPPAGAGDWSLDLMSQAAAAL